MYYSKIKPTTTENGQGIRVSLFVSGCHFRCKGCHNKEAWDFEYGEWFDYKTLKEIIRYMDHKYIQGLSILGGEPLHIENYHVVEKLCEFIKILFPNKDIWIYTGYDKLANWQRGILKYVDVLVMGRYEEEKRVVGEFYGSSNQKIVRVINEKLQII